MSANPLYTKQIISDYCVLDTETTGLSAYYDEIIEVALLRVRNNEIVASYSQLIQPSCPIDPFVSMLTGITNSMVRDMPSISEVKDDILSFLGDDIIVGHNTPFDRRFLIAGLQVDLPNQYMDTFQFSRKLFPELEHHRLSDMTELLGLHNNEHRALSDCISTKELYDYLKAMMASKNLGIEDLWPKKRWKYRPGAGIDIHSIVPENLEIDEDGFFFNRRVVFTGKLEKMLRKDAMQLVVNLGAVLEKTVTSKTNYLILGNNDYNAILKGEKSSKHKKAEKLKLDGQDIEIIDELTFYDLLEL